jgi:hypothetical protein
MTFGRNPLLARFNVFGEVIQNGLPALTLLRLGMGRLRIESYLYLDTFKVLHKLQRRPCGRRTSIQCYRPS